MRQDYTQKRKDISRNKNGVVYLSRSFICRSILELMRSESKRSFVASTNLKSNDMSKKDPSFFIPANLHKKLSDIFLAFYGKKLDRNTFYTAITELEQNKKLERIKIKRQVYYKLI